VGHVSPFVKLLFSANIKKKARQTSDVRGHLKKKDKPHLAKEIPPKEMPQISLVINNYYKKQ